MCIHRPFKLTFKDEGANINSTPHRGVLGKTLIDKLMAKLDNNKKDLLKRLRYVEGHVKAVAKMIEGEAYCMDIINQNHAVIEALRKVNHLVLEGYLGECALDAVSSKSAAKRKAAVMELVKLYSKK